MLALKLTIGLCAEIVMPAFAILVGFDTKIGEVRGKCDLASLPEIARDWGGNQGIRIGQGIRFHCFSAYLGPWGVDSGACFVFLGVPLRLYYFPIISLFPRCGCAVLCTLFCPAV